MNMDKGSIGAGLSQQNLDEKNQDKKTRSWRSPKKKIGGILELKIRFDPKDLFRICGCTRKCGSKISCELVSKDTIRSGRLLEVSRSEFEEHAGSSSDSIPYGIELVENAEVYITTSNNSTAVSDMKHCNDCTKVSNCNGNVLNDHIVSSISEAVYTALPPGSPSAVGQKPLLASIEEEIEHEASVSRMSTPEKDKFTYCTNCEIWFSKSIIHEHGHTENQTIPVITLSTDDSAVIEDNTELTSEHSSQEYQDIPVANDANLVYCKICQLWFAKNIEHHNLESHMFQDGDETRSRNPLLTEELAFCERCEMFLPGHFHMAGFPLDVMSTNPLGELPDNFPLIEEIHEDISKAADSDVIFTTIPGKDDMFDKKHGVATASVEANVFSAEDAYEKVQRYCELTTNLEHLLIDIELHCDQLKDASQHLKSEFALRQSHITQLSN